MRANPPASSLKPRGRAPVIVLGSGLAGLTVALELADSHDVIVLSKRSLQESATSWAQGGIVGVIDELDNIDSHVSDTVKAGAGLVDREVAQTIALHSTSAIEWLIDRGVPFTSDPDGPKGLHLVREGGHSHRRIAHAADATGQAIHDTLLSEAQAHKNISLFENFIAVDLILGKHLFSTHSTENAVLERSCYGVYAFNISTGRVEAMPASAVVLATGGAGKVYRYTSNPETATGDGIAMAWRAGCRVANMEFIQFHPTCLYHPEERTFLITEALRGEGARLELPDGTRFMPNHDTRAELAPRDIVARAIDFEMKRHGLDFVHLNATHLGESFLKEHFPTIYSRCLALGIDISTQPIPVVPAAHYTCGGVVTDMLGRTDLTNLFAVGECACTGLHGANRLASNSLLECVVVGRQAAKAIAELGKVMQHEVKPWDESMVEDADETVVIAHNWDELRLLMWNYVGIVRTDRRLERALNRIKLLQDEVQDYYVNFKVSRDLLELRNLLDCAQLIVESALSRKESRGLHYTRDYPKSLPVAYPTVLTP
ncbi:MAG: L-aspartate oxidase [Burkholderiaceae bacterium]